MGLFDYIRCKMPLPAEPAPPKNPDFQTKFFDDPYMERYTIEADGRLIHHKPRYDITPPDEVTGDIEVPLHGDLDFCDYDCTTKERWQYIARFTEGRCVRIWLNDHWAPETLAPSPSGGPRDE